MTTSMRDLERAAVPKLVREIVTPEGIPLRFQLARASDRVGAFALDATILIVALVLIGLGASYAGGDAEGSWLTAIVTVTAFVLTNFYFAFFEIRWQGATPGKRKAGIRVIDARGGQLETTAVLARNFIRELEVWMPLRLLLGGSVVWPGAPAWAIVLAAAWALVFLFFPLFNKDRMRVGDLIAGTRVVMQPDARLVPDIVTEQLDLSFRPTRRATFAFTDEQLRVYGIYELQVLEGVLRQNPATPGHSAALNTVVAKITAKIRYEMPVEHDELFLRDFYAALRAHLEQRMLFGDRREDKHART